MTRANLNIDEEIKIQFLNAQDKCNIRMLMIKINNEQLILNHIIEKVATAEIDFETILISNITEDQAAFVLYCLTDARTITQEWLLLLWIPDNCRVRDKMLYSSSCQDLKRSIGLGYLLLLLILLLVIVLLVVLILLSNYSRCI